MMSSRVQQHTHSKGCNEIAYSEAWIVRQKPTQYSFVVKQNSLFDSVMFEFMEIVFC